ncbi:fibrinolytic enzyme, isozyme C-like [Haliotis asinina]|uniref:fibrinolytic enzyme, isozyme C-like n=1 Tax=Haliotis asinina TaxID=109174 RepID=UPI003532651F
MKSLLILCLSVAVVGADVASHIVGGSDAKPNSWQWQGSLRKRRSSGEITHTCGCSLLGSRWALTAAHCVDDATLGVGDYRVVFGGHRLSDETGFVQTVGVSKFVIHPGWRPNQSGFPNDIALIQFDTDVVMNSAVMPANLVDDNDGDFAGESNCFITGWGKTAGSNAGLPDILQQAPTNVISYNECRSRIGSSVRSDHICAFDYNGVTGGCNGDSGGPLVCQKSGSNQYTLLGAASWVISGCVTSYPTVYARASSYLQWIRAEADF